MERNDKPSRPARRSSSTTPAIIRPDWLGRELSDPAIGRARYVQHFPNSGEPEGPACGTVWLQMKRILNTSEVLGAVEVPEGSCELCATADAGFDDSAGRMVVKLESFLRPAGLLVKERHFRADWLPANEMVTESVAREECHEMARDIFHRWVRKVRAAAPALHHV